MDVIFDNFDLYRDGFFQTLEICLYAGIGSLLVGTLIATFRVSPIPPLRWFGTSWVNVFRNCPLTVVLFMIAFGLPEIGTNSTYFRFGVAALILYTSAFVCEAVRSGINAVALGQAEAARAIGLTFGQTMREVVLPQALRTVIPPLGSVLIAMVKNSAILGAFGVGGDLFSVQARLTSAQGEDLIPVLTGVIIGYLIITLAMAGILAILERKLVVYR